jgi:type I restriction enzyme S subunit
MASEWPVVRLGDVVDLVTGFPFESHQYTDDPTAPRLLRGDNVAQGVLRWDGAKRWPPTGARDFGTYWLREGDVILAMDRPWIEAGLKFAAVRDSDLPALLVQRVARLRGTAKLDTPFLKYVIAGRAFTQYVTGIQTGTAVPHISGGQIRSYEFPLPPISQQRAIAQILGTLDDKIELNRRMSETLEAISRALYKSWFVDFDPVRAKFEGRDPGLPADLADLMPDSFADSELGDIPAGWKLSSIGEVAEVIDCLHSKKPERRGSGEPLIQLDNLRDDGLLDLSDPFLIDEPDYRLWTSRMEARTGDCVITNVGRVGAVAQIPQGTRAALGRNMTGIRCRSEYPFPTFLIEALRSDRMADEISLRTDSGTILDALNVRNIPRLRIVVPTESVLRVYEGHAHAFRARMEAALQESHSLARVRDALLPQLLSGQLRADGERFRGIAS